MKFIYRHQLEIFKVRGLGCKEKLSSWINFKRLAYLCLIALRYYQIFLISPIYQNTLHHIVNMEFYHLNGSFLFPVTILNFYGFLFPLFFFLCIQKLSQNRLNETFYIATPSPTLLIKILNMKRAIPLKFHLEFHILLLPWPLYL